MTDYLYEIQSKGRGLRKHQDKTFKQAYEQAKSEGLDKFCFEGVWVDANLSEDEAFKQFRNGKEG